MRRPAELNTATMFPIPVSVRGGVHLLRRSVRTSEQRKRPRHYISLRVGPATFTAYRGGRGVEVQQIRTLPPLAARHGAAMGDAACYREGKRYDAARLALVSCAILRESASFAGRLP